MAATTYTPSTYTDSYGNINTNPLSANYLTDSGQTPASSMDLQRAIQRVIFDCAPAQYNAMKLFVEKPFEEVISDEFDYKEKTFGRSPLIVNGSVLETVASGMTNVTQTVVVDDATRCSVDQVVIYPAGEKGVINAKTGNTLTIKSYSGLGLPALADDASLAIQSAITADGVDYIGNYERIETLNRYNYIQFFARAERWDEVELIKQENMQLTDLLDNQKRHKLEQIRYDIFSTAINGTRGEYVLSGGKFGKAAGGAFPLMVAGGSQHVSTPLSGLATAIEST